MANEKQPTVIKKYANRRLYHTGTSTYVTLEDLALLVRKGEDFLVYDAKSSEDITRSVLTQIIFEEESKEGQQMLPVTFLRQLIRFYGDSMQAVVPRYLEMSMDSLTKEQNVFREQLAKTLGSGTVEAMETTARTNIKLFTDAFRLFNPFMAAATGQGGTAGSAGHEPVKPGSDIDSLKQELNAMRDRLDKLAGKG
jgi:polyhydroxyalkanoate synthesis repressor PhaR